MAVETPDPQRTRQVRPQVQVRTRKRRTAKRRAALSWWVGTVILTLFPTLSTILVAALHENTPITLELVFGDGEIILASFLIVASTSLAGYNISDKTVFSDAVRYILLFLGATQLIAYTTIKTNDKNEIIVVIVVSLVSMFMSICVSWIWYQLTNL